MISFYTDLIENAIHSDCPLRGSPFIPTPKGVGFQGLFCKLAEICQQKGLTIVRNLIGSYITSLEMQGCSITLLKLDAEMIPLWDAPVKTPALRW
jgi:Dak1 domain